MRRNLRRITAGIAFLLLVSGGSGSFAYGAPLKKAQKAPVNDRIVKRMERPDPFLPFLEKEMKLKAKVKKVATLSIFPLQRLGLEQFKLVGIAGDARRRLAVVESMDGKGKIYPLKLGTVIGLNKGKVVQINSDSIVVEEVLPGPNGPKINRIIKKLHRDEEEGAT